MTAVAAAARAVPASAAPRRPGRAPPAGGAGAGAPPRVRGSGAGSGAGAGRAGGRAALHRLVVGGPEGTGQLEVDLDPASAEFYDYTTTEWYREPARTGQPLHSRAVRGLHLHAQAHVHGVGPGDGRWPVRRRGGRGHPGLARWSGCCCPGCPCSAGRTGYRAGQRQRRPGDRLRHRQHPARHGAAVGRPGHDGRALPWMLLSG